MGRGQRPDGDAAMPNRSGEERVEHEDGSFSYPACEESPDSIAEDQERWLGRRDDLESEMWQLVASKLAAQQPHSHRCHEEDAIWTQPVVLAEIADTLDGHCSVVGIGGPAKGLISTSVLSLALDQAELPQRVKLIEPAWAAKDPDGWFVAFRDAGAVRSRDVLQLSASGDEGISLWQVIEHGQREFASVEDLQAAVRPLRELTFDDATVLSAREDRFPDRDAPAWRYDHSRVSTELLQDCLGELDESTWEKTTAAPGYRDGTVLTVPLEANGQHYFDLLTSEHLIAVAAAEVEREPIASYFITPYEVRRAEARAVSDP